eukprot:587708_1
MTFKAKLSECARLRKRPRRSTWPSGRRVRSVSDSGAGAALAGRVWGAICSGVDSASHWLTEIGQEHKSDPTHESTQSTNHSESQSTSHQEPQSTSHSKPQSASRSRSVPLGMQGGLSDLD